MNNQTNEALDPNEEGRQLQNEGSDYVTAELFKTITITESEYAKLKEDAERMNYLSNGGWEVLQDPKYWTDNLNLRQVIDREAIDKAISEAKPITESVKE